MHECIYLQSAENCDSFAVNWSENYAQNYKYTTQRAVKIKTPLFIIIPYGTVLLYMLVVARTCEQKYMLQVWYIWFRMESRISQANW